MIRINATFDEDFLKRVDQEAQREKTSRSGFIRKAIEEYLRMKQREDQIRRAMSIQDSIRKKSGLRNAFQQIRANRNRRC
ncbi:ribbon-helix-helix protein, CopG family [candidate division KSB1 bacterium]|nr:ribbon-helix-helix protein, CopG family [candidate division KSB1 bacterium]